MAVIGRCRRPRRGPRRTRRTRRGRHRRCRGGGQGGQSSRQRYRDRADQHVGARSGPRVAGGTAARVTAWSCRRPLRGAAQSRLVSPGASPPSIHRPCCAPEPLLPLSQLVTNLRWSWHPESRDLFEALDPELWQRCGGDPVKVLGEVSAERLAALARDRKFLRRLQRRRRRPAATTSTRRAGTSRSGPRRRPSDRLLLRRVRHHRGAAAVLRRPGHPGRRPPQGRHRPRRAAHRRRAALPRRLLPPGRCPPTAGSSSTTRRWTRTACRSSCCASADGTPSVSPCRCPRAARCTRRSGGPRSAGCRCCCSTATSRRTRRPSAAVTDRLYGGGEDHRLRQEMLLGIGGVRAVRAYCAAHRHPAARGLPHQRGPRRLPRRRADPRAGRGPRPGLRRGAAGRPRRHGLHHPHPGARPASTASRRR